MGKYSYRHPETSAKEVHTKREKMRETARQGFTEEITFQQQREEKDIFGKGIESV